MYNNKCFFDLSDMEGRFNNNTNKKVLEKFKDEMAGVPIKKFIRLISKMYSIIEAGGEEKRMATGIVKNVIVKELQHKIYKKYFRNEL